jgi:gluconolactonase
MKKTASAIITILLSSFLCPIVPAQSPIPAGAEAERITTKYQFVEGPVWLQPGFLVFSDINANKVYRWNPDKTTSVYYSPSGNSNGLTVDSQGRLILAQHGKRRVARLESNGLETDLASTYTGKKLNSPNDVVLGSDGSIYFTDPPYGINASQEELKFYGIYRIAPTGELTLLDKTLQRPNGIVLSPDEKKLYVDDSQACKVYVWDIQPDLALANKKLFVSPGGSVADGMDIDTQGRLYISGNVGIWIYDADGNYVDEINVPETATNCCWGEAEHQTLFITAGTSVYRIKLTATGTAVDKKPAISMPVNLELHQNFPNPFNPNTTISFSCDRTIEADIQVFDLLGHLIKTLGSGTYHAGTFTFHWDATNTAGHKMASGLYYCRLAAGQTIMVKKMLFLQ